MSCTRRSILAALGAAFGPVGPASPAWSRPAADVMLARDAPAGIDPRGFLVSEKFDGVRALWDGRQLRFRSGLPVMAPAWFIERLPHTPLDGELWLGRGRFEALSGAVRRTQPQDAEWRNMRYQVFDLPGANGSFAERARRLQALLGQGAWPGLVAVQQTELPDPSTLQQRLAAVVAAGGEGLMLHRATAAWRPGRSDDLLKLKPLADAEAVVVGHVAGRGKHAGRLGALRVRADDGTELLLGTGLSDAQREHPPAVGSVVTFTYRGRTATGVPRFAAFLRVRSV